MRAGPRMQALLAALLTSTSDDPKVQEAAWAWLKFITSGEGAAEVAKTTGYMPPNKAANEVILADFYDQNPNRPAATVARLAGLSRRQRPGDHAGYL